MKFTYPKSNRRKWHEKFAWLPTLVDDDEERMHTTVVWFENYMRRYNPISQHWKRYSKQAYFKQQLGGDTDVLSHDSRGTGAVNKPMGSTPKTIPPKPTPPPNEIFKEYELPPKPTPPPSRLMKEGEDKRRKKRS